MSNEDRIAAQVAVWRAEVARLNGMIAAATGTPPAASGQQDWPTVEELLARILPPPGYENHIVIERAGKLMFCLREDMQPGDAVCLYDGDMRDIEKPAAHAAPAQQESGPKPFAYFVQPSGFGPFIECDASQVGAFAAYRCAPAPAALTDEQIMVLKKCLYGGELFGWSSDSESRAILATVTASAAPAEQARDAARSMIIGQAVVHHHYVWPEQLYTGVMFFNGQRITKAEFDERAAIASQQEGGGHA